MTWDPRPSTDANAVHSCLLSLSFGFAFTKVVDPKKREEERSSFPRKRDGSGHIVSLAFAFVFASFRGRSFLQTQYVRNYFTHKQDTIYNFCYSLIAFAIRKLCQVGLFPSSDRLKFQDCSYCRLLSNTLATCSSLLDGILILAATS